MTPYPAFEGFAYNSLNANWFGPERRKKFLGQKPIADAKLKSEFQSVLAERPYTAQAWEDLTAISFDTDEEVYELLWVVYRFMFEDGPTPKAAMGR